MIDIKTWFPEFKVSSESDRDLMKYFVKTRYVIDILESDKWLILGRKGTGKTAIFEYLKNISSESGNGFNTISLNFKDYPWPIHKLYKETMEGELTAYQQSWHYLFIVQAISKLLLVKEAKGEKLNGDLQKVKILLENIYGDPSPSVVDVIKSKIARVGKIKFPEFEINEIISGTIGELSFEEVAEDVQLKNKLKSNSFTLLKYLNQVFLENIKDKKILIILDQLDESWLRSELDEYSKMLINLINICKFINTSNEYDNILKVVPFLRTDIYETLLFNDKNKIYQDSAIEIRWDEASLDNMFYERIKLYKPENFDIDLNLKSNSVFEIKYARHGATPLKHIIRRSFLRPRDIIVYMNKINAIHKESKTGLYTSSDIYEAEKDFSISMYNELIDEWSNQKPYISELLAVLQNIGYQTFTFKEFEEKYSSVFSEMNTNNMKEDILFLFSNSILGQKLNANWEYFCGNPHMIVDFEKSFHVNSALKSRLMLTEGQGS